MSSIHLFELVISMFLVIVVLHYIANKLKLPPTVALLTGGSLLAFVPGIPNIAIDPELVLVIFLPPLLMDGAWFIPLGQLRRHLMGIGALAVGAVLFTTVVITVITHFLIPSLPWAACAALGAIVSPPDAISARAVLQRVKLPHRLRILLEGESLLNDASGLVLFRFAIAAAVTGVFSIADVASGFFILAIGGFLVGAALGGVWRIAVRRLGDEYLVIAATVLMSWGSYILGEMLNVSGVIATVTAGLIMGWHQHTAFSASVRMRSTSFWTVLIFLMETAVFMLIGLSLRGVVDRAGGFNIVVQQMGMPILVILFTLMFSRFVWVFGSDFVIAVGRSLSLTKYRPLGTAGATVLSWAGVRGVVTLALALSVPVGFPGRDFIIVTSFAIILGTFLLEGTTLGWIIKLVKPREDEREKASQQLTMAQAEARIAQVQLELVKRLAYDSEGKLIHPQLLDRYERRSVVIEDYSKRADHYSPIFQAHFEVVLEVVAAGRNELIKLHRAAKVDDEVLHELERDLDLEELTIISAKA